MAHLLANPPCRVIFAGFESDTYKLGGNGWDISLEEDPMQMVRRLLLRFKPGNLVCFATCPDWHLWEWRSRGQQYRDLPIFHVKNVTSDMRIHVQEGGILPNFKSWADTTPVMLEEESIYKHPLFLSKEAPKGEELIVDPNEVQSLLERIKQLQAPNQAEIRKRRAKETPIANATILSFGT